VNRKAICSAIISICAIQLAPAAPLAKVSNLGGTFKWIKLANIPVTELKSLSRAKSIVLQVTFPKDVKLKKDKWGNKWFTFIVADQGADWKWTQTAASGAVPLSGETIKAGSYSVVVPSRGIPAAVLKSKQQTISVGPAASGFITSAAFTITAIKGG
jgi:hypothetical protein